MTILLKVIIVGGVVLKHCPDGAASPEVGRLFFNCGTHAGARCQEEGHKLLGERLWSEEIRGGER